MDTVADARIETIVIMSSAQVGKTEIINNIVGYFIDQQACLISTFNAVMLRTEIIACLRGTTARERLWSLEYRCAHLHVLLLILILRPVRTISLELVEVTRVALLQ